MLKEGNNKESTSNVNVVITILEDLDPQEDSDDRQPTPIEDIKPFQIGENHISVPKSTNTWKT